MTSFDYRLNPHYPVKECSSCGALYTTDFCCSVGILRDKIIYDLDKTPDLHGILQDSFDLSNDNPNVVNALRDPIVVNQDPGKNSSQSPPQINCCHGCGDPLKEPFNNLTIKELLPTVKSFDPKSDLVHDSPNVFNPPPQLPFIPCEFCGNDARYGHYCTPHEEEKQIEEEQAANARYWKIPACYDDDDDDCAFPITPNKPVNSLSMGDEHLNTISATE
nr:hypothetical protein [Tanacetum cinerariifolium]